MNTINVPNENFIFELITFNDWEISIGLRFIIEKYYRLETIILIEM